MSTSTYTVERSTEIAAEPQRIFAEIIDFHRWPGWSPWERLDPHLTRTYTGPDSGPGAAYAWTGNRKAGRGHMTIEDAESPTQVGVAVEFEKPFKSSSRSEFLLQPAGSGSTRVTWRMTGSKTAATKVMGLFVSMDKFIGPDFERGLAQLKTVVETA